MHIAKGVTRTDLALHTMTLQQKDYLCAVERELERTQVNVHRQRQHNRAMQRKLQVVNLRERLACYEAPQLLRAAR